MSAPYYGLLSLEPATTAEVPNSLEGVRAARDALVEQQKTIALQIISANALLNAFAPVNRLPNEILVHIFREAQSVGRFQTPWYAAITAVCRGWRAIACSTPLLWSDITVTDRMSLGLYNAFLDRSYPASISLSFDGTVTYLGHHLALLRGHLARVKSLDFQSTPRSEASAVASLLKEERMPVLEKLSAKLNLRWVEDDNEEGEGDDALNAQLEEIEEEVFAWSPVVNQFPRLTELSLRGIVLGPSTVLTSPLRRLELRDCISGRAPISVVLRLIRESPDLEELTICRYRFSLPASGQLPLQPLQRLQTLHIEDIPHSTAALLNGLSVPPTTDVSIVMRIERNPDQPLVFGLDTQSPLHLCLPADRTRLPILSQVNHVHVEMERFDDECIITGTAGSRTIKISSKPPRFHSVELDFATDLVEIFGDAPLTSLVIAGVGRSDVPTAAWRRLLGQFPLLQRLVVIGRGRAFGYGMDSRHTVLEALKGGRSVLCPNLRELAVSSHEDGNDRRVLEDLRECLESRQARGQRLTKLHVGLNFSAYEFVQSGSEPGSRGARRMVKVLETVGELADEVECGSDSKFFSATTRDLYEEVDAFAPDPDALMAL
ncbi:hypothetical protein OH77DRAFT_510290 [Trametes cingulata]|nr:hypothetical protein OH77DRAFT_510290 [Trametes cingulata]